MNIPVRNHTDLVRDMSAAITASAGRAVDMSVGSILRAIIDANASIAIWVQWLVLLVLQATRAITSNGPDLDSWMADFSLSRKPAQAARGIATFSRHSPAGNAMVAVGTPLKTADGTIVFKVVGDPSNSAWQDGINAYSLPAGVLALDLPIEAVTPGSQGNILAGTIALLAASVPGVDTVSNSAPTYGGTDAEDDNTFRQRFQDFFAARSRATVDAIAFAIETVGMDLKFIIQENVNSTGARVPGTILILAESRAGGLSSDLQSAIFASVNAVRPVGTNIVVLPPDPVPASISLSFHLTQDGSPDNALISRNVSSGIADYIMSRPIGGMLSVTKIAEIAYRASNAIDNVNNVRINGLNQDFVAPPKGSFRLTGIDFTQYVV